MCEKDDLGIEKFLLDPRHAEIDTGGYDAPEFKGLTHWINSEPQSIAGLQGKVVMLKFWTSSCPNCMATHAHSEELYLQYKDVGFEVIGIHSPEFSYEKKVSEVQKTVDTYAMTFPIALDNDFLTWKAYKNKFWPTFYLIDASGKVRYMSYGKDKNGELESMIQRLLEEKVNGEQGSAQDLTSSQDDTPEHVIPQYGFKRYNLMTNTAKASLPLSLVQNGGPDKDGIPAIHEPKFISMNAADTKMNYLSDTSQGIAVILGGEERFYPYEILVWHEIVNDSIGENYFSVTFCPLCGSAIVYDREVNGQVLQFGVSGKLFQSNLLMYDNYDESLWSQGMGKAVIGDQLGTELRVIQSHLMTYGDFKKFHPQGNILSDATGHRRAYGNTPYGDYDETDQFYFPVENADDARFHPKKLFYIINDSATSLAFAWEELVENKNATLKLGDDLYEAQFMDGKGKVVKNGEEEIPGYMEMWFSWIHHNQKSKNVWSK